MKYTVLLAVLFCAVLNEGWAQNRGSVRYSAPAEYEEENSRIQRPHAARGIPSRRQRPTKTPDEEEVNEEPARYKPPEHNVRTSTTARRAPQRNAPHQLAPVQPPPAPAEISRAPYSPPGATNEEVSTVSPEKKSQGRRRRPKKRRRPITGTNAARTEQENPISNNPEEKVLITKLLDDDSKRPAHIHSNSQSRNAQQFNPSPQDASVWTNNKFAEDDVDQNSHSDAGAPYLRPQQATNRLPIRNSEEGEDSRGYAGQPRKETSDVKYFNPVSEVSNTASYVPVLQPIRPSGSSSRLPLENTFVDSATLDRNRELHQTARDRPVSLPNHRENIRESGAKPSQNLIPQEDKPNSNHPLSSDSEVRLPQDEQPLISRDYISSPYDSSEDILDGLRHNDKAVEEIEKPPVPTNRLPNPSEVHYDSIHAPYINNAQDIPRARSNSDVPYRRQGPDSVRNVVDPHSTRNSNSKPQQYDNNNEDRRQSSRYQPPLQRAGSRYRPNDSGTAPGFREETHAHIEPTESHKRSRGSTRYESSNVNDDLIRTRGPSRQQGEIPQRTRNPTRNTAANVQDSEESTRYRGPQREAGESNARRRSNIRSRQSQPHISETPERPPESQTYVQGNTESARHHNGRTSQRIPTESREEYPQEISSLRSTHREPVVSSEESEQDIGSLRNTLRTPSQYESEHDIGSLRNTLRSRPQYEYSKQEFSPEEQDYGYVPQHQTSRQQNPRNEHHGSPVPSPPSEYEIPQNPRTNRNRYVGRQQQSHHPVPQNPSRQNDQTNLRQQQPTDYRPPISRSRHQQPQPVQQTRPRTRSSFSCPDAYGFYSDPVQCDKYYECRNGTAEEHLCSDGLAFNEISSPKFLRCDSLRDVDCRSRPELQEAQPTKHCPRKFGLFPHESDCTKFWNCVDGSATEVQCPPGLTYNDDRATCDWADLVKSSCKTEDLLGFSCPEPTAYDLQDGVYTRYPHPTNCQLHFTCIKGEDGLRRPRLLSCNEGLVFNADTGACTRPDEVPGCEEFYGKPSPQPNRQQARQPPPREPEEEVYEDPSTPRPRRRGSSRRTRN